MDRRGGAASSAGTPGRRAFGTSLSANTPLPSERKRNGSSAVKKSGLRSATRQSARGVSAPGTAPRSARRAPPSRAGDGGFEIYTPGGGAGERTTPAGGDATPRGALSGVRWDDRVAGRPASARRVGTNLADRFNSPSVANDRGARASDSKVAVSGVASVSSPRSNAWDRPLTATLSADRKPAGITSEGSGYPSQQLRFSGRPAEILSPSYAERVSAAETRPSPAAPSNSRPSPLLSALPATSSPATASAAHLIDSASSASPRSLGPSEYAMRFPPGPIRLGLEAVTAASGRPTGCSVSRVPADLDVRPDEGTAAGATVQANDLVVSVNGVPVLSRKFDVIADLLRRLESEEKVIVFRSIEKVWKSQFQRKTMRNVRSGRRVATALDEGAMEEGGLQTWVETPTQVEVRRRGRGQRTAVRSAEGKENNKLENISEAASSANPASTPTPKRTSGGEAAAASSPFVFSPSNVRMMSASHPASPEVQTAKRSNAGRVPQTTPGSAVGKARSGSIADEIGRALAGTPGSEFERSLRLKKGVLEELREVHLELERLRSEVAERDGRIDSLKVEVSSKDEDARGLRGKLYQAYRGEMSSGKDTTDLARERDEARKELESAKARIDELERHSKESVAEKDRRLADREKSSQLKQVEIARLRMSLKEAEKRESQLRSKLDGLTSALSDANDDASKTSKLLSDERARSARQDAATNRRVVELERLLSEETDKHATCRAELADEKESARVSAKRAAKLEKERDEAVQRLEKERASFEERERRGKATKARHMSEMKALAGRLDETKAEASKSEAKLRAEHDGRDELASRLGEANDTIKSIEGERNKAKEECDRLKTSVDELRSSVDSLETEKASLADQVRKLEAESSEAKSLQSDAVVRLIDARDELSSVRTSKDGEIDILKQTLRSAEAKQKSELEVSSNEVAAARAESDSLRDANGRLEGRCREGEASLASVNADLDECKLQLSERDEEAKSLKEEAKSLKEERASMEDLLSRRKKDHEQARAEADEAQTLLVSLNSDYERCRSELGRAEEELRILEAERADTRAQLEERATKLDQAEAAAGEARSRQASLNMHLEGCKNELARRNEELTSLRSERDAIRELLDARTRALEQAKAQSSEEQSKHASVVADLENSKNKLVERSKELERAKIEASEETSRLVAEVDASRAVCDDLRSKLGSAETLLDRGDREIDALAQECEALESELETARARLSEAQTDVSKQSEEIEKLVSARYDALSLQEKSSAMLASKEAVIDSFRVKTGCLEGEVSDLASRLEESQSELSETRGQRAGLASKLRDAETLIAGKQAAIESLRSERDRAVSALSSAEGKYSSLLADHEAVISSRDAAYNEKDRLGRELAANHAVLDELNARIDELTDSQTSSAKDFVDKLEASQNEAVRFKLQCVELQRRLDSADSRAMNLSSDMEGLARVKADIETKLLETSAELEKSTAELSRENAAKRQAEDEIRDLINTKDNLKASVDSLSSKLQSKQHDFDALKECKRGLAETVTAMEDAQATIRAGHNREVAELSGLLDKVQEELDQSKNIRVELESELKRTESDLREKNVMIEELHEKRAELEGQIGRLDVALRNSSQTIEALASDLESAENAKDALLSEKEASREKLRTKQVEAENLADRVTGLTEQVRMMADSQTASMNEILNKLDDAQRDAGQSKAICAELKSKLQTAEKLRIDLNEEAEIARARCCQLEQDVKDLMESAESSKSIISEQQTEMTMMSETATSLESERNDLIATVDKLSSDANLSQSQIDQLKNEVEGLSEQLLSAKDDLRSTTTHYADEIKAIEMELKSLSSIVEENEDEIERLNSELESACNLVNTKTSELEDASTERERLMGHIQDLTSSLISANQSSSGQNGRNEELRSELDVAVNQISALSREVDDLKLSIENQKSQIEELEESKSQLVAQHENEVSKLRDYVESSRQELHQAVAIRDDLRSELQTSQDLLTERRVQIQRLLHECESLKTQVNRLNIALENSDEMTSTRRDESQALSLELTEMTSQIRSLHADIESKDESIGKLNESVSELQSAADKHNDEQLSLQAQLDASKGSLGDAEDQCTLLTSTLRSMEDENALLIKEHALLKATVSTITNDLSQSQRNGERQAAHQNELEQSLAAKEHDIKSLVAQREKLLASNAVLSSKVKSLEVDSRRKSLSAQVTESQNITERRDLENLRAGDRLKVVQLSSKVDALEASLRSKETDLSRLADEKEELIAKLDADGVISSQLDESKRQLEEERTLSTNLASKLESLSASLSSREGEIYNLKHDIVCAEERVASLMSRGRIAEDSLKSKLSAQSLNHEELRKEFQERINDLTEDRDRIRGELQESLVSLAEAESTMAQRQKDVEELSTKVAQLARDKSSLQEKYDLKSSELKSIETRAAEDDSHRRKVQMLEDEVQAQKLLNSNLAARLKMEKVLDRRDATLSKMIDTVSSLRATTEHDESSNLNDELSELKIMLKSREVKIEQLSSDLSRSQENLRKLRDSASSEASELTKSLEEKLSEATSKFEEQRSSFKSEWTNFQQVLQELIACMKHEDGGDSIGRLPDLGDQMSTLFSLVQSKEEHLVRVQTELAQLKSVRDTRATELDAILDSISSIQLRLEDHSAFFASNTAEHDEYLNKIESDLRDLCIVLGVPTGLQRDGTADQSQFGTIIALIHALRLFVSNFVAQMDSKLNDSRDALDSINDSQEYQTAVGDFLSDIDEARERVLDIGARLEEETLCRKNSEQRVLDGEEALLAAKETISILQKEAQAKSITIENLQDEINDTKRSIADHEEGMARLQDRIVASEESAQASDSACKITGDELASVKQERDELVSLVESKSLLVTNLESQLAQSRCQLLKLEQKSQHMQIQLQSAQDLASELNLMVAKKNEEVASKEESILDLRYQVDHLSSRINDWQAPFEGVSSPTDAAKIVSEASKRSSQIAHLEGIISELQKAHAQQLSMNAAMIDGLESEYDQLSQDKESIMRELDTTLASLQVMRESKAGVENGTEERINELKLQLEAKVNDMNRLESTCSDLRQQLDSSESKCNAIISALCDLAKVAAAYSSKCGTPPGSFNPPSSSWSVCIETVAQTIETLSASNQGLELDVVRLQDEISSLENRIKCVDSNMITPKAKGRSVVTLDLASQHSILLVDLANMKNTLKQVMCSPKLTPIKSNSDLDDDIYSDLLRAHEQVEELTAKVVSLEDKVNRAEQADHQLDYSENGQMRLAGARMLNTFVQRHEKQALQQSLVTWSSQSSRSRHLDIVKEMARELNSCRSAVLALKSNVDAC